MAGKLKFAQNLYLGEGIAPEKLDKLKKRLNKKPLLANVYPVSYTHLDVYKRQLYHWKTSEGMLSFKPERYVYH